MTFHAFTSITANYLPKARVLAYSLKKHHSNCQFHLFIADKIPRSINLDEEPFDSIIQLCELPIANIDSWIFMHTRVELCTAVKAMAFLHIFSRYETEKVFFFDPDIVILSSIEALCSMLNDASILLTPHQTIPEQDREAVIDNEICSLKHGIYNLGFLGVRRGAESLQFLQWWQQRLHEFCYDNIPAGLFTDQRWIDLVPAFFPQLRIVRDPVYNVATWNLTHRKATGSLESGILINGQPLCFFHFSGIDSGEQKIMLKKYMDNSHVLLDLHRWYIQECKKLGQRDLGSIPDIYSVYDNGQQIGKHQRLLYRTRADLQKTFPNPFSTKKKGQSYYHWYDENVLEAEIQMGGQHDTHESLQQSLSECRAELNAILNSRSWKIMRKFQSIYKILS
jgi:hypothetical protein